MVVMMIFAFIVLQLALEDGGGSVAVSRAFLEAVILFHGLVIQILAVYHKQHLVDIIELRGSCAVLKEVSVFTAARGVPDIAAACNRAELFCSCWRSQYGLKMRSVATI